MHGYGTFWQPWAVVCKIKCASVKRNISQDLYASHTYNLQTKGVPPGETKGRLYIADLSRISSSSKATSSVLKTFFANCRVLSLGKKGKPNCTVRAKVRCSAQRDASEAIASSSGGYLSLYAAFTSEMAFRTRCAIFLSFFFEPIFLWAKCYAEKTANTTILGAKIVSDVRPIFLCACVQRIMGLFVRIHLAPCPYLEFSGWIWVHQKEVSAHMRPLSSASKHTKFLWQDHSQQECGKTKKVVCIILAWGLLDLACLRWKYIACNLTPDAKNG